MPINGFVENREVGKRAAYIDADSVHAREDNIITLLQYRGYSI